MLQMKPLITQSDVNAVFSYMQDGGWLTEYKKTEEFENKIAELLGVEHCIATTSGTMALMMTCVSTGIKKVAVPNLTMVATSNAPKMCGVEVVFVDVDETGCIDINKIPDDVEGVIYVSFNGRCGDIEKINKKYVLIEDSCQALMSQHNGRFLGTYGDVGCFSLSPHKIITTGQGGVIVTNNRLLYEDLKRFKDFGREVGGEDIHNTFGINGKYTDLQACIGISQLDTIEYRVVRKKAIYQRYVKNLSGCVDFIETAEETVPWMVDIYIDDPKSLKNSLLSYGIQARLMYPTLNKQEYQKDDKDYPVSARMSARGLWLPSSLSLSNSDIDTVCGCIRKELGC